MRDHILSNRGIVYPPSGFHHFPLPSHQGKNRTAPRWSRAYERSSHWKTDWCSRSREMERRLPKKRLTSWWLCCSPNRRLWANASRSERKMCYPDVRNTVKASPDIKAVICQTSCSLKTPCRKVSTDWHGTNINISKSIFCSLRLCRTCMLQVVNWMTKPGEWRGPQPSSLLIFHRESWKARIACHFQLGSSNILAPTCSSMKLDLECLIFIRFLGLCATE